VQDQTNKVVIERWTSVEDFGRIDETVDDEDQFDLTQSLVPFSYQFPVSLDTRPKKDALFLWPKPRFPTRRLTWIKCYSGMDPIGSIPSIRIDEPFFGWMIIWIDHSSEERFHILSFEL
jgi:hypothetical protein